MFTKFISNIYLSTSKHIIANSIQCLKWIIVLFVTINILSCNEGYTYKNQEKAEREVVLRAPTQNQLNLSLDILPQSLFIHGVRANDGTPANSDPTNNKPNPASLAKNRISPRQTTTGNNTDSNFDFDPFSANAEFNATEANCGLPPNYEPSAGTVGSSLHTYGTSSFCLITVAKLAVMRAVGNYANFGQMLPQVVESLAESNNPPATLHTFHNGAVSAVGADGVRVEVYYDECSNHRIESTADPQAFTMCADSSGTSIYHRVKIFPLNPKNGTNTSTAIGKMEWLIHSDGATSGKMIVSRNLMSDVAFVDFAPPQVQFDFNSDQNAEFKSFTMKFTPLLPPGGSVSRHMIWDANVIHVERIPEADGNPALWVVQGNILFTLNLSTNPLFTGGFSFEPFGHNATPRVYFTAVAEDIFADGNAVYQAIMSDSIGLRLTDFPEADWPKEFHMWASYKKMLATTHSQAHYENSHGYGDPQQIFMFNYDNAQRTKLQQFGSHTGSIADLAINSTGTIAVSASIDGTIGVWDIDRTSPTYEQQIYLFPAPHGGAEVDSISFSPVDDNLILSGGHDGYARVFDLTAKQEIASMLQSVSNRGYTVEAEWSHDGTRIATASNQGSKIWDANSGTQIAALNDWGQGVHSIAFDPTNNNIVVTAENVLVARLWNISTPDTPTMEFTDPDGTGVNGAKISPDGTQLAMINKNNFLHIWNITNNTAPISSAEIFSGGSRRTGTRVLYSEDGANIYVQAWASIIKFKTSDLSYSETYVGYSNAYNTNGLVSFAVFPGGTNALVGHNSAFYAQSLPVNITGYNLDYGSNTPIYYIENRDTVYEANFSPDGSTIVSADSAGFVEIWDAYIGGSVRSIPGHTAAVFSARFSADGSKVVSASADGTARVWDANTGTQLLSVSHPGNPPLTAASFSPDGNTIVTASGRFSTAVGDGTVFGWDVATGNAVSTTTSLRNTTNQWLASAAGTDQYYLTSSTSTDPFVGNPDSMTIGGVAATPGTLGTLNTNEWAYGDLDSLGYSTIYIHSTVDPDTLALDAIISEQQMRFDTTVSGATYANDVFFSPVDNTKLAIATNEGSQWWSTTNATTPLCLLGQTNFDRSVHISNDGKAVVVAGANAFHIWSVDADTPSTYCTETDTVGHSGIGHARFSPLNNNVILSHSVNGGYGATIHLWDMDPTSANYKSVIRTFSEPANQLQFRRSVANVAISPDEKTVITTGRAAEFNPAWIDFDGWFAQTDGDGKFIRPDEDDNANPYYVDFADTTAGCFTTNTAGGCNPEAGFLSCADVGGCKTHNVVSQFTFDQNGTTPDTKFNYLKSQLEALQPQWFTETYSAQTID